MRPSAAVQSVAFDRTKYGPEILVDVAWVHDIPTFILDRAHRLEFFEIVLVTRGTGVGWLCLPALRSSGPAGLPALRSSGPAGPSRLPALRS
jgi:hypothetical protein